jgi:DNA polymerase (family 10)
MIGGRSPIDLDVDAIVAAAGATGTALEINGAPPRLDMSVEALRKARGKNVTFVPTSDAHYASNLERARFAAMNAERAWLDPDRALDAGSPERLVAWAAGAKPARATSG